MDTSNEKTELLAPAGDFQTALAAFDAGADAVYCGLANYSARAYAKNLAPEELDALMRVARAKGRKVYVTFNTLVEDAEMQGAFNTLALLDEAQVDGIIVQDLGIAKIAREHFPRLALHASTQLVAHNLEGVLALKELGFVRAVLARELSMEDIDSITKRCGIEIECFIHGALCYSLSGLCLFSAMENERSGNRGKCAYSCRMAADRACHPFSMRDLRLGESARRLAACGVRSLKIEGRMKSALYVASAVKYYREILDGAKRTVSEADLETIFSRRTTKLYFDGPGEDVVDLASPGHVGTSAGTVKKITRDREGAHWLRMHATRALERHDGLQIVAPGGERKCGFGISRMRLAISRANVFEAPAGSDVEIFVSQEDAAEISPGDTVCQAMSNEMKRRFPPPAYRPADYQGIKTIDATLAIRRDEIRLSATAPCECSAGVSGVFESAKNPSATREAALAALSRLGGTAYRMGALALDDPEGLFAPAGKLNELRRLLVAALDEQAAKRREDAEALATRLFGDAPAAPLPNAAARRARILKVRAGREIPAGDWDELVIAISPGDEPKAAAAMAPACAKRIATPVFTAEKDFSRLRTTVKRFLRAGFEKWEVADLAVLRMLKALGVSDITADWTLYAANRQALAALAALGVRRFVASPEASAANLEALAAAPFAVEFLETQATPLFISLNKPGAEPPPPYKCHRQGPLWITTRDTPRSFAVPANARFSRTDFTYE